VPARLAGVALAVFALLLAGSAGAAATGPKASAKAFGVRVVAGGETATAGSSASPPQTAASLVGWEDASGAVSTGAITAATDAGVADGTATGRAHASVASVVLFGGEITVQRVDVAAVARASGPGAGGRLAGGGLSGVTVLGQTVTPGVNSRLQLGDWGYVVFQERAVVSDSGTRYARRNFVTGLHVHLVADHAGLPAGSDILVGYAEAAASAPKEAVATPPPTTNPVNPAPEPQLPKEPVPPPPGATPKPPPIVENPPRGVKPELTNGGYVFPVYGPASFTDDFRAGRADTGWHHGNDIFAALGAPVLAVSDGTLFLVGWNPIGGNRLWVRDESGNEFYYAHLAAYSPIAREGARVEAGDVIGFVGATGDAVGTPPHLHFEVHPQQLLWMGYDGVVDPYPYLLAWQRLEDASFDVALWSPPPGKAPPPAAVLLGEDDISSASALAPEGLAALLGTSRLFGEAPPPPTIVEAEPGFSP
jgi:murein DD-endopeptidase MepM/ murein hydrolase activator NlpD